MYDNEIPHEHCGRAVLQAWSFVILNLFKSISYLALGVDPGAAADVRGVWCPAFLPLRIARWSSAEDQRTALTSQRHSGPS